MNRNNCLDISDGLKALVNDYSRLWELLVICKL